MGGGTANNDDSTDHREGCFQILLDFLLDKWHGLDHTMDIPQVDILPKVSTLLKVDIISKVGTLLKVVTLHQGIFADLPPAGYPQTAYPFPSGYPPAGYPGLSAQHHSGHGGHVSWGCCCRSRWPRSSPSCALEPPWWKTWLRRLWGLWSWKVQTWETWKIQTWETWKI